MFIDKNGQDIEQDHNLKKSIFILESATYVVSFDLPLVPLFVSHESLL